MASNAPDSSQQFWWTRLARKYVEQFQLAQAPPTNIPLLKPQVGNTDPSSTPYTMADLLEDLRTGQIPRQPPVPDSDPDDEDPYIDLVPSLSKIDKKALTVPIEALPPILGGPVKTIHKPKVGIIGAGAAGLYIAMILDSLEIEYEILEASDRVGGRLFTHRFGGKDGKWNYFDVGAMRYPDTPVMGRLFDLFRTKLPLKDKLIEYLMTSPKQALLFNARRIIQQERSKRLDQDWFHDSVRNAGAVPAEFVEKGVQHWMDECLDPFREIFKKDWDDGFKVLMDYDQYSARGFMRHKFDDGRVKKEAYPATVVNWLERMTNGTGSFDLAFVEVLFDSMAFDFPAEGWKWYCIEGGSQVLADSMLEHIKTKPVFFNRVTAISPTEDSSANPLKVTSSTLTGHPTERTYDYVISTIPMATLRLVNYSSCNPSYHQKEAPRMLNYWGSCKVGLKFKTRWWQTECEIKGGVSMTDRPTRVVVYPSYGIDDEEADAVMIASYTWSQDALRYGSMMTGGHDSREEQVLIDLILEDLAVVHHLPLKFLQEELLDWFAWNWLNNPYSIGAFAMFGPDQFKYIYPAMTQPAAAGRLFFAGEALSSTHGWVEGALESAYWSVHSLLRAARLPRLVKKLEKEWKQKLLPPDEWEKFKKMMDNQTLYGAVFSACKDGDLIV